MLPEYIENVFTDYLQNLLIAPSCPGMKFVDADIPFSSHKDLSDGLYEQLSDTIMSEI
jgi:hypothetical protein